MSTSTNIAVLEKKVEAIQDILLKFSGGHQERRLISTIFNPLWCPSSAEYTLISQTLDGILEQARGVSNRYSALMDAAEKVGLRLEGALLPQKVRNGSTRTRFRALRSRPPRPRCRNQRLIVQRRAAEGAQSPSGSAPAQQSV